MIWISKFPPRLFYAYSHSLSGGSPSINPKELFEVGYPRLVSSDKLETSQFPGILTITENMFVVIQILGASAAATPVWAWIVIESFSIGGSKRDMPNMPNINTRFIIHSPSRLYVREVECCLHFWYTTNYKLHGINFWRTVYVYEVQQYQEKLS